MSDSISEDEKGRRLAILQDRQREIQAAKNVHFVGGEFEVLVSGKSRRDNQWTGYTTSHRMINFASQERELLGTYVQVRDTGATANSLAAEHLTWLYVASMGVYLQNH